VSNTSGVSVSNSLDLDDDLVISWCWSIHFTKLYLARFSHDCLEH
jgi:hypothetical protein